MVMNAANRCWEDDDFQKAEELFRQAAEKFEKLRDAYPDWNRELVAFRLAYCRLKIRELRERKGVPLNQMTREQLLEEVRRLRRLEEEQAVATERLKGSLETAEIIKKTEEIERLREENDGREKKLTEQKMQLALLEKKAKAGERDRDALQTMRDRFEELLVERDDLKEKLTEANGILPLVQQQLTEKSRQLANTEKKLSEAEKKVTERERTIQELRTAAEAAQGLAGEKKAMRKVIRELEVKKDYAGAAKFWSTLAGRDSGDAELALRAAYWHWRSEQKDLAQRWLEMMFQRGLVLYNAYLALSCASLDAGQTDRALALAQWAVAMSPNNADAHFILGAIYLSEGDNTQAEKHYRRTLELNPQHNDCMVYLAIVLSSGGREQKLEARQWYRKALSLGHAVEPSLEACFKDLSRVPVTP